MPSDWEESGRVSDWVPLFKMSLGALRFLKCDHLKRELDFEERKKQIRHNSDNRSAQSFVGSSIRAINSDERKASLEVLGLLG
jgi:hypothetical protein